MKYKYFSLFPPRLVFEAPPEAGTIRPTESPAEAAVATLHENVTESTDVLKAQFYGLGADESNARAPKNTKLIEGSVDATDFREKQKLSWYRKTVRDAKTLVRLLEQDSGSRFTQPSLDFLNPKLELLKTLANTSFSSAADFRAKFEQPRSYDDVFGREGAYNIVLSFQRILDMYKKGSAKLIADKDMKLAITIGGTVKEEKERYSRAYNGKHLDTLTAELGGSAGVVAAAEEPAPLAAPEPATALPAAPAEAAPPAPLPTAPPPTEYTPPPLSAEQQTALNLELAAIDNKYNELTQKHKNLADKFKAFATEFEQKKPDRLKLTKDEFDALYKKRQELADETHALHLELQKFQEDITDLKNRYSPLTQETHDALNNKYFGVARLRTDLIRQTTKLLEIVTDFIKWGEERSKAPTVTPTEPYAPDPGIDVQLPIPAAPPPAPQPKPRPIPSWLTSKPTPAEAPTAPEATQEDFPNKVARMLKEKGFIWEESSTNLPEIKFPDGRRTDYFRRDTVSINFDHKRLFNGKYRALITKKETETTETSTDITRDIPQTLLDAVLAHPWVSAPPETIDAAEERKTADLLRAIGTKYGIGIKVGNINAENLKKPGYYDVRIQGLDEALAEVFRNPLPRIIEDRKRIQTLTLYETKPSTGTWNIIPLASGKYRLGIVLENNPEAMRDSILLLLRLLPTAEAAPAEIPEKAQIQIEALRKIGASEEFLKRIKSMPETASGIGYKIEKTGKLVPVGIDFTGKKIVFYPSASEETYTTYRYYDCNPDTDVATIDSELQKTIEEDEAYLHLFAQLKKKPGFESRLSFEVSTALYSFEKIRIMINLPYDARKQSDEFILHLYDSDTKEWKTTSKFSVSDPNLTPEVVDAELKKILPPAKAPKPQEKKKFSKETQEKFDKLQAAGFDPEILKSVEEMPGSPTQLGYRAKNNKVYEITDFRDQGDVTDRRIHIKFEVEKEGYRFTRWVRHSYNANRAALEEFLATEEKVEIDRLNNAIAIKKDSRFDKKIIIDENGAYYNFKATEVPITWERKNVFKIWRIGNSTPEFNLNDPILTPEIVEAELEKLLNPAAAPEKTPEQYRYELFEKLIARYPDVAFDDYWSDSKEWKTANANLPQIEIALDAVGIEQLKQASPIFLGDSSDAYHVGYVETGDVPPKKVIGIDVTKPASVIKQQIEEGLRVKKSKVVSELKELPDTGETKEKTPEQEKDEIFDKLAAQYNGVPFSSWTDVKPSEWKTINANWEIIKTALDGVDMEKIKGGKITITIGGKRSQTGAFSSYDDKRKEHKNIAFDATLKDPEGIKIQFPRRFRKVVK